MDEKFEKGMQEIHLDLLSECGALKFPSPFATYTSGKIGTYYVHSENIMRNGVNYNRAITDLGLIIDRREIKFDVISGGESRDWIFSLPLINHTKTPQIMIYKDGRMIGADVGGKRVLHVADLNNEGSSPRDIWVLAIRDAGGKWKIFYFMLIGWKRAFKL